MLQPKSFEARKPNLKDSEQKNARLKIYDRRQVTQRGPNWRLIYISRRCAKQCVTQQRVEGLRSWRKRNLPSARVRRCRKIRFNGAAVVLSLSRWHQHWPWCTIERLDSWRADASHGGWSQSAKTDTLDSGTLVNLRKVRPQKWRLRPLLKQLGKHMVWLISSQLGATWMASVAHVCWWARLAVLASEAHICAAVLDLILYSVLSLSAPPHPPAHFQTATGYNMKFLPAVQLRLQFKRTIRLSMASWSGHTMLLNQSTVNELVTETSQSQCWSWQCAGHTSRVNLICVEPQCPCHHEARALRLYCATVWICVVACSTRCWRSYCAMGSTSLQTHISN